MFRKFYNIYWKNTRQKIKSKYIFHQKYYTIIQIFFDKYFSLSIKYSKFLLATWACRAVAYKKRARSGGILNGPQQQNEHYILSLSVSLYSISIYIYHVHIIWSHKEIIKMIKFIEKHFVIAIKCKASKIFFHKTAM